MAQVDMTSRAPAQGTPARHFALPSRSPTGLASNLNDLQTACENQPGLWGCPLAGASVIIHSAGWVESGLTISCEKLITDVEVLNTIAELCAGNTAGADEIGVDSAISEFAPRGHFFASGNGPDIDGTGHEALRAFIEKRTAEGGAPAES